MSVTIAPWLSVRRSAKAVDFYVSAFEATVAHVIDGGDDGVVAQLVVHGAHFWVSEESPEHGNFSPETIGGSSARMILTVPDPHTVFDRAVNAGATVVSPVSAGHGWLVGRVADPFGHHWEIGRPLSPGE